MNELRSILKGKMRELKKEISSAIDISYDDKINLLDRAIFNPKDFKDEDLKQIELLLQELRFPEESIKKIIEKLKLLVFVNKSDSRFGIQLSEEETSGMIALIDSIKTEIINIRERDGGKLDKYKSELSSIDKINTQLNENEYVEDVHYVLDLIEDAPKEDKLAALKTLFAHNNGIRTQMEEELSDYEDYCNYESLPDRLDESILADILKDYNYDIKYIDYNYLELLKKRGNISRIKEVLETLKKRNIQIDISDYGKMQSFVNLIIKGDRETMERSFTIAEQNGLSCSELIDLTSALIKQKKYVNKEVPSAGDGSFPSLELYDGAATNFVKNVELFSRELFNNTYRWDLKKVFKKCSSILIQPHKSIEKNLMLAKAYGIDLTYSSKNTPSLSSLKSTDFAEKMDRFIEIDDDACFYIRQNLSRLRESDSLVYKLQCFSRNKSILNFDPYVSRDKTTGLGKLLNGCMTDSSKVPSSDSTVVRILNASDYELRNIMHITDLSNLDNYNKYESITAGDSANYYSQALLDREEIKDLEENYSVEGNDLLYNINNVRISKPKVLRIYQRLVDELGEEVDESTLLYAVTYHSLLDENQLDLVKDAINKKGKRM